ncbi:hypothetical protein C8C83_2469 [Flavobacterium sp. 90]|uniref:hypothetical protein n=1 Tax=unclassified Flavobacterium TaxID=196869 RepID=UPI000EADE5D9|nr:MULTISPECIES: hypothetical protein [unclassified Flavobacterium]RKR10782.1 hypothetical protein C8C82_2776 [Flavobacterium sp. 81]TCK54564.1 hypothetical protein C8C83_2469 [Flavobacterium sp. 90]
MKNVLVIIILISFKITAQISEAPGLALPLNNPKNRYQELVNTYLNPNRNSEFNYNNYSFNNTDFDLKKEKIVKKLSIDNNSDGINEYHLSFNPKGKIVLCEDLLRNYTMTYEYFENLIIVTKTDRNSNYKNIVQSAEIDSIFFDKNENIIKHSFTMKVSEKFGKNYKRIVVENQFSKDNKLEKKYYNSIDHINIPLEEVRETVYQNYKDSIVEKDYYIYRNKLSASDTISYKNNFASKSVYYLNQNNKISRITNFGQDLSLNREVFINYDEFGNITEFLSSRGSSGYFKYNSKGNISSIRQTLGQNEDFQYDCIYDNHDRFISAETDGKKIKEFERNYTYDKYGNWVTLTFINNDSTTTRTITYY